jgi:hypothetical protein
MQHNFIKCWPLLRSPAHHLLAVHSHIPLFSRMKYLSSCPLPSRYPLPHSWRTAAYLLGLGLLPLAAARAQTAGSYQLAATAGTFTPLAGGTAVPAILRDDAVSGSLPIGFAFKFGGVSYTSFQASSNGLLGFGGGLSDAGSSLGNTLTSPDLTDASLPALAPFWTDLSGSPSTGATAQYSLSGTAPNQVLTMEWLNYKDLNGDAEQYISFQVRLYETTNRIEYCYRKGAPGEAADATIGLKSTDGSYLSLSSAGAAPTTSTTTSYNRLNRPATGQVYAFGLPATPLAATPGLAAAEVSIFPNPARASFTVLVPAVAGSTSVQADLLNTLGQVVQCQAAALPAAGARLYIGTARLPVGVYSLRLQAGSSSVVKRVVLD